MPENKNYILKNVFAMNYSPKILQNQVKCRPASTFLYIVKGKYLYEGKGFSFSPENGDIVYIPKSAQYSYSILSDETHCIQITFNIECSDQEIDDFLATPFIFRDSTCTECMYSAYENYSKNNIFYVLSDIYRIISIYNSLFNKEDRYNKDFRKIKPAIEYINKNFSKPLYVSNLAEMCKLSQAQLRRLFIKCFDMSPIQYKNHILILTSCNLIKNEGMSISDVVKNLNYTDVYSFSKLFKKHIGISPSEYSKKEQL